MLSHCTLICISWWLIMIWEWDDRCTDSKNHWWMDLTMSKLIFLIGSIFINIMNKHCNHTRFFLFNIKKFNKSISEELFKIPFLFKNFFYMLLPELKLIFLDDKHCSHTSTSISVNFNFSLIDISANWIFFWKLIASIASSHLSNFF